MHGSLGELVVGKGSCKTHELLCLSHHLHHQPYSSFILIFLSPFFQVSNRILKNWPRQTDLLAGLADCQTVSHSADKAHGKLSPAGIDNNPLQGLSASLPACPPSPSLCTTSAQHNSCVSTFKTCRLRQEKFLSSHQNPKNLFLFFFLFLAWLSRSCCCYSS